MLFCKLLFLVSLVMAYDRKYIDSPCPNLKPVSNFNFTAAAKRWYENARFSNDWIGRGDCVYVDHTRDGSRYTFTISDVVNHKLASVGGAVETKFDGDNAVGHIIDSGDFYMSSENESMFEADVLSIDYDSYCIVHHCKHDSKKKFHHEFIWILSRTPDLSPDTRKTIEAFLNSTLVDQRQLIWDHFSKQYCDVNK